MTPNETPPVNDEWRFEELQILAARLQTGFKQALLWLLQQIRRNALLLLLAALLVTGWQVYRIHSYQPYYEGKASFIYKELHKKTYGEMIDRLEQLAQEGAYEELSAQLQISQSQARQISEIRALNMYGSRLSEDITSEKAPFYVQVKLRSGNASETLASKITGYLNNNPYNKESVSRKKITLAEEINDLEQERRMLDSFKLKLLHGGLIPVSISGKEMESFNPVALFDKSIDVAHAISDKKANLNNMESVSLLNDFSFGARPVSLSKKDVLLKALAVFALATIGIVVISSILRKK